MLKAFLAILRGRDKRKTLGRVLDRAAIVRVNRAHEGIAAYFHDNRRLFRETPRKDSGAGFFMLGPGACPLPKFQERGVRRGDLSVQFAW